MVVLEKAKGKDQFCKNEVRQSQAYHESEQGNFLVLHNTAPLSAGHSLIITKRHILGILDLTLPEKRELFDTINKILPMLLDVYNDGNQAYDIKIRSGAASGRTVDHFHVHLIPRKHSPSVKDGIEYQYERIYEKSLQTQKRERAELSADAVKGLKRELASNGYLKHGIPTENVTITNASLPADIADNAFYESKYFLVAHSANPIILGHSLIVPKRDVDSVFKLTQDELCDLAQTYSKIMSVLLRRYGDDTKSYITSMQTGGYPAMPLDKLHIHVIPRFTNDRYTGKDDEIYYDIYERGRPMGIMGNDEIRREVEALKR